MAETNYVKALNQALVSAYAALRERDLKEVAFKSGASLEDEDRLRIPYLNRFADVMPDQDQIMVGTEPADMRTAILILHYLLKASGTPLTGQMISFKEAPQGGLYDQPFRGRVIYSMLGILDNDATRFEECAKELGGEPIQAGDMSYRFRVFPYVTVQYVWYAGEEEMPPDLNLLFDASISEYLSTEDIVVMCEELNRSVKTLFYQK